MEPVPEPHKIPDLTAAPIFPPQTAHQESGFFHHFWAWMETCFKVARLRGQLALIEAKQAGSHYGFIVSFFAAAVLMGLFGYLFLVITIVFALALLIDDSHGWLMVMGGAALLHILAAFVLIFLAKSRAKIDLFAKTKEEFQKDNTRHEHSIA